MTKLNEIRGGVEIDLDRPRRLRFTLNGLAKIEDKYGDLNKAIEELSAGKLTVVRFLLWIGLIHEDPALTEEQVGDLVDVSQIQEISTLIGKAFGSSMPEATGTGTAGAGKNRKRAT